MYGSRHVITPSWLSRSLRPFLYSSSVYSCHLFLISSASVKFLLFLSFFVAHFCMKCSRGISNFFEEISSLFHSIVFLYFFCIVHFRRRSYLSLLLFFETLYSVGYIFPFSFAFHFSFQLFIRPSQTTTLPSCISFFLGMVLVTISCTMLRTSVHSFSGTLSTRSNP